MAVRRGPFIPASEARSVADFRLVPSASGLEPTSSVAPRVPEGRLHEKTLQEGRDATLLCLAQAYPVPHSR